MIAIVAALGLLAADTAAKTDAGTPATPGTGRIAGKVTLAGLAPSLANLPVTRDLKICGSSKPDEALEVGVGGGVKNVVLWLPEGPKPTREEAARKVKLDQQACAYVPHLIAAPVGATLNVTNSDPVLHNVHATEKDAKAFNYAMPLKGHVVPTKLNTTGTIKIACDVHPWMHAVVHVLPTSAYSVTNEGGTYLIENVPPGHYKLHLSHERLGERDDEVDVTAGQTVQHDLSLTPR